MHSIRPFSGLVYLVFASLLLAQDHSVSLYQLGYKPVRQARRLVDKGIAQLKQHRYQAGLDLFRQAVELDPRYWQAQNNFGYASLLLGKRTEAEAAFQKAVAIDPLNAIGHINVGICAIAGDNYQLAEASARKALRLRPGMAEAKALLGMAEAGRGRWTPQVRHLLEEARSTVPEVETLLRKWPSSPLKHPKLVVLSSAFQ